MLLAFNASAAFTYSAMLVLIFTTDRSRAFQRSVGNGLAPDVLSRAWKTALAVTSNWLFVHQKLGEKVRRRRSWQVIWQHEFKVFAQIGALDGHGGETAGGDLLDDA